MDRFRDLVESDHDLIDTSEALGEPLQPRRHSKDDRRSSLLENRREARELDRIAETLLRPHEKRLALQILSTPARSSERGPRRRELSVEPAKLVLLPSLDIP